MSIQAYILMLAQDGGGSWIFPIVVLIFAILGSLFKKKAEKAEEKTRERRKVGRKADEDDGWIEIDSGRRPGHAEDAQRRQNLRETGPVIENRYRDTGRETRIPRRAKAAQAPPPPTSAMSDMARARQKKASQQKSAASVTGAAMRQSSGDISIRVNLAKKRTAKAAIIFSEILSPPKALREGPERWDM